MYYSIIKQASRYKYRIYNEEYDDDMFVVGYFTDINEMIKYADITEFEVGSFLTSILNEENDTKINLYISSLNQESDFRGEADIQFIRPYLMNVINKVFLYGSAYPNYDRFIDYSNFLDYNGDDNPFSRYMLENSPMQVSIFFDDINHSLGEIYVAETIYQILCHELILLLKYNIKLGICPSCGKYYIVHNNMRSCGTNSCKKKSTQGKFYSHPIKKTFYDARSLISSQAVRNPDSNVNASDFFDIYKCEYKNYIKRYDYASDSFAKNIIEEEFKKISRNWVKEYRESVNKDIT